MTFTVLGPALALAAAVSATAPPPPAAVRIEDLVLRHRLARIHVTAPGFVPVVPATAIVSAALTPARDTAAGATRAGEAPGGGRPPAPPNP